jgi:hypothetical protein
MKAASMNTSKLFLAALCAAGCGVTSPSIAKDYFLDGLISPRPVLIIKERGMAPGSKSIACDIALYAPLLAASTGDTAKINDLILNHIDKGVRPLGLNCKKYLLASLAYNVTRADRWTSMNVVLYIRPREGVHGVYDSLPITIDTQRGKVVPLQALFKHANYRNILNHELKSEALPALAKKGLEYAYQPISADQNYYLTEKDLVICYQQYDVGPGAAGVVEIPIPLATLRGHLIAGLVP